MKDRLEETAILTFKAFNIHPCARWENGEWVVPEKTDVRHGGLQCADCIHCEDCEEVNEQCTANYIEEHQELMKSACPEGLEHTLKIKRVKQ